MVFMHLCSGSKRRGIWINELWYNSRYGHIEVISGEGAAEAGVSDAQTHTGAADVGSREIPRTES